jgi:DNA adenine methylase
VSVVTPLLKWAGGKRQLLPELRRFYPPAFGQYIEPFVGSGAVFFDLYSTGRLDGHDTILIDSNPDLIGCYEMVRDHLGAVATALAAMAERHQRDPVGHYYGIRDQSFNPLRERRRRPDGRIAYTPEMAAMLIYLNRTGFNGLFRVNAAGAFNVPLGRYVRPRILDADRLMRASEALRSRGVRLTFGSFMLAADHARSGDFLYIDPPYAPVSRTANFTSYTAGGFNEDDQRRLQRMVVSLARRGCRVLVSNSATSAIESLYGSNRAARAAGLRAWKVTARRAINSDASRRAPVAEYLITNAPAVGV